MQPFAKNLIKTYSSSPESTLIKVRDMGKGGEREMDGGGGDG